MSDPITHQEAGTSVRAQTFPFMKLPTELRLQVYRHLLISKHTVGMKKDEDEDEGVHDLHPEILRTCQQVYDEAVEVLYGENTFDIYLIDHSNPNASRVKRAKAWVAFWWKENKQIGALTRFLDDHPDLTHLFLGFTGKAVETEAVRTAIERALQGHNGPVRLEVCVENPLSQKGIDFCWQLKSIISRNSAPIYAAQTEFPRTDYPPFVKVDSTDSALKRQKRKAVRYIMLRL
jgi:hypothetical protein